MKQQLWTVAMSVLTAGALLLSQPSNASAHCVQSGCVTAGNCGVCCTGTCNGCCVDASRPELCKAQAEM